MAHRRRALVNCVVYLGQGNSIAKGYVVFTAERVEEVGAFAHFNRTSDTEVTDLRGALVLPGLVDSHIHLMNYAKSLIEVDLADTHSLEEGLRALGARVKGLSPNEWLCGRGWDKQRWRLEGFPTRWMLDRVAPENPVALTSRDGHLLWLNSAAMQALGLADKAVPVEGGQIAVDRTGRPTGIFKERAANLALDRLGAPAQSRLLDAVSQACGNLCRMGITGAHTIEAHAMAAVLDQASRSGKVSINLFRMREVLEPEEIDNLAPSAGAECVKTYADGTLGSQTASMLEPFSGQPDNLGIPFAPKEKLREIAFRAAGRGFAVSIHAIGDRANREVLDIYEELRQAGGGRAALLRVEHAQVVSSQDIPRFRGLGVVASMQPVHLVPDRPVAELYWGDRSSNAYAWKKIMAGGGTVAFGSDAPIESPDPLKGIHAAVTRSDPARRDLGPWFPEERLEVWQALDCYSRGAAAASRQAASGYIEQGSRPDFTIIDTDILSAVDPEAILGTRVVATVVGGVLHTHA